MKLLSKIIILATLLTGSTWLSSSQKAPKFNISIHQIQSKELVRAAQSNIELGYVETAEEALHEAHDLDPNNEEAHQMLINLLLNKLASSN